MNAIRRRFLPAVVILGLAGGTTGCGYNQIQTLDESAAQAKQQISVQLQRRADLIPNVVATVQGFASHETEVFTAVADARSKLAGAIPTGDLSQMAAASQQLNGALGRLLAISENYPQLKSNENFLQLQDQLEGTENRIAVARTDYNNAVNAYNTYIRKFPQVLTAKVMGMKPRDYYELADQSAAAAPKVSFPAEKKP